MPLSNSQKSALAYIETEAKKHKHEARSSIHHILKMSNVSTDTFEKTFDAIKANARIALHFHPDRLVSSFNSVVQSLFIQGEYKSQFETLISAGSVSAFPGGERDLWERRLFGGAYHGEDAAMKDRPKYGALNLMLPSDGPAPRFGSCYFLLYPSVSHRSTFTYLDSHLELKEKGTFKEFDLILAALLEDSFSREFALGEAQIRPPRLFNHLLTNLSDPQKYLYAQKIHRNLDHYIEAQIHGPVSLRNDVEILVADTSFRGTDMGEIMEQLCSKYSIQLHWRRGFHLTVQEVPSDFRGVKMPVLAKRIAETNDINARIIGSAMKDMYSQPEQWSDYGTMKEITQDIKLLWHVLVRYGSC